MGEPNDLGDLSAFLAGIVFFAPLDEAARREVAGQLDHVQLSAGDVLFRQGDDADGLYLVASGRLRVTVEAGSDERNLYDLGRGSVVGEMALFTQRPRAATVTAVRDCELRVLRRPVFQSLLERTPALATAMIGLLADRLFAVDQMLAVRGSSGRTPANRTVAVVAAGRNPGTAAQVAGWLTERLGRGGPVLRVDAAKVDDELGLGAAQRRPGEPGRGELTEWLHAVEAANAHVIYEADIEDTPWSRACLSQADVVLLVAAATDDATLGPTETRALATPSLRCELALLHAGQPSGTVRWLDGRPVADHHQLRTGEARDVARLARMISGTGCGLVLGGGGPRGFAHLGVLRALEQADIPIDVVGGTSIGAMMAAAYALGMDDAERVAAFTHKVGRLVTFTLPVVAVSSGRRVDRLCESRLGSVPIEDLPRRFFCVSASLNRAEAVVHERGPLWPAVRASVSLPGIFPPVYDGGDLLVDGGAVNNVPADLMRDRVGGGCVIAVSVASEAEPLASAAYGPGLSGWRVFGQRLNPFTASPSVPRVADIITRSISLSQVGHQRASLDADQVDLLLQPPVGTLGGLNFKAAAVLIESGYAYASEVLASSGLASRFVT